MAKSKLNAAQKIYLTPEISEFKTLPELIKSWSEKPAFKFIPDKHPTFAQINEKAFSFIIGEPGYGKSTLIKKLAAENTNNSIIIDCKELRKFTETDIQEKLENKQHAYFDGLDEVSPIDFLWALDTIQTFQEIHKALKITIACRSHYINRYQPEVSKITAATFYEIGHFNSHQVRSFLEHHIDNEQTIELILNRTTTSKGIFVLRTPRYLEAFVQSIKDSKLSDKEIETLGRTEIFEKVIYHKLNHEVKESQNTSHQANEVYITQRVLEKLAFVMEIYQINEITKQELITYLDEVQSNVSLMFLNSGNIDEFIERTLKTVNHESLSFENTEFQEYLAAKELIRLSNTEQSLYDIILHPQLRVPYLNWYDVLQYALELNGNQIINSLSQLINSNPSHQLDERLIDLLLGEGIETVDKTIKANLFTILFNYYQHSGLYLFHKNDLLARLYDNTINKEDFSAEYPNNFKESDKQIFINKLLIVSSLALMNKLEQNLLSDWQATARKLLEEKNFSEYLETQYYALERLGAYRELIDSYPEIKQNGDTQISIHLRTLANMDADGAIDIFSEIIQQHPFVKTREEFIDKLKSGSNIKKVLDFILDDNIPQENIFGDDHLGADFDNLFSTIETLIDTEIDEKIKTLLLKSFQNEHLLYQRNGLTKFIGKSISYILKKHPDFIHQLLQLSTAEALVDEYAKPLEEILDKPLFKILNDHFKNNFDIKYTLKNIIHHLRVDGKKDRQELLKTLSKDYSDLFKQPDTTAQDKKFFETKAENEYQRFKKLSAGDNHNNLEMLRQYYYHAEDLETKLNGIEKQNIITTLSNLFNAIDFNQYYVSINRESNGNTSFNTGGSLWVNFPLYFKLALKLNQTELLAQNRAKIIQAIPMLNHYLSGNEDLPELVLEYLKEISEEEQQELFDFCNKRTDDFVYTSARSFCKFIADHKLIVFKPLLKNYIESSLTDTYDRTAAIETLALLFDKEEDKIYLQQIFKKAKLADQTSVMEIANEKLITKFKEPDAIKWRVEALKSVEANPDSTAQELFPIYGFNTIFGARNFGHCLYDLPTASFDKELYDLFRWALTIRTQNDKMAHSDYLYRLVSEYFRKYASLEQIQQIQTILDEPQYITESSSFKSYLATIEAAYLRDYKLYKTISDPIKKYNQIKQNTYLPIYHPNQLHDLVGESLEELESFIGVQGFNKPLQQLFNNISAGKGQIYNEDIAQKTTKLYLENSLLRKGIRQSDIQREVELFDGKRIDLLINYGFVGPVMLELKLLNNDEIQKDKDRAGYKPKLIQYMKAMNCSHAYYLIFKRDKTATTEDIENYEKLIKEYSDIQGLRFVLIDTTI